MNLLSLLHQGVLLLHISVFAMTLSAVLREDWRLLTTRRIDAQRQTHSARALAIGLSVLWSSGLMLIAFDVAFCSGPWAPGPRLAAKLLAAGVLTANGLASQGWVLPRVCAVALPCKTPRLLLPAACAAIGGASWLAASLAGVAEWVAPRLPFAGFMALYGLLFGACVLLALIALCAAPSKRAWPRRRAA